MANTKIPSELIDGTLGVAGITSSADATAITIGSDESVDFAKGIVVEGSGTTAGVYLNGTNSDTATQGNFVRYGTNFATQSNAANDTLITKTFNGSTFVDALNVTSAGNVGIGTTSPNQDGFDANASVLSVKSANNGEGVLELIGGGNNSGDQISVINFMSQAAANPAGQIIALRGSADDEAGITFNNSGAQRMSINSDGNVTISKGLTVGTTVQPTSGELDGTGQSGTNVLTIGDTTKSLPAILLRSSVTNANWLAQYTNTSGYLNTYNTDTNKATISQKANGSVNFPNQPSFHAHTNADGTTGTITFTQTGHNIGSHYSTSNGRFTAPVAGRYLFTFAILVDPAVNGNYERILFAVNGTTSVTYGDTLVDLNFSSLSSYHALTASTIISLSANDYVSLSNSGQSGTYGSIYGNFCGQLLS